MAKILFSALIADARGKFGGGVFSRNNSGSYLREFKMPVNPNTPAQQANRAMFGATSQGWRSLTEEQRELWRRYSNEFQQRDVFGENYALSGFQLYTKLNNNLSMAGFPRIAEPQGFPAGSLNVRLQLEPNAPSGQETGVIINAANQDELNANMALVVWVAGPISPGRKAIDKNEFTQRYVRLAGPDLDFFTEVGTDVIPDTSTVTSSEKWCIGFETMDIVTGIKGTFSYSTFLTTPAGIIFERAEAESASAGLMSLNAEMPAGKATKRAKK